MTDNYTDAAERLMARIKELEAEIAEFKSWQPMNTIPNYGTPIEILDTYNGKVYSVTKGRMTIDGGWGYSCFLDKWGAERTGNWRPLDWKGAGND